MKLHFSTWILFASLFVVLSANSVRACGDHNAEHAAKFHKTHVQHSHVHATASAYNHTAESPDQPCPEKESGHCHCPCCCALGCHNPLVFMMAMIISIASHNDASVQRQAFYFADHLPETVCLPIWQPPKWV